MLYTPALTKIGALTVRRLAGVLKLPMTKTIDNILAALPLILPPHLICEQCKEKEECSSCYLSRELSADDLGKFFPL
jgi:hypothetical protein